VRAGWGGYSPGEVTVRAKKYLSLLYTIQNCPSILAADVFGTGIFQTSLAIKQG